MQVEEKKEEGQSKEEDQKQQTWWAPIEGSQFRTRIGPDYKRNHKKDQSEDSIFTLFDVKMYRCDKKVDHGLKFISFFVLLAKSQFERWSVFKTREFIPRFLHFLCFKKKSSKRSVFQRSPITWSGRGRSKMSFLLCSLRISYSLFANQTIRFG